LPLSRRKQHFAKEIQGNGDQSKEMEVLKPLTRKQEQAQRAASSRCQPGDQASAEEFDE
jgi:hypothetical protein